MQIYIYIRNNTNTTFPFYLKENFKMGLLNCLNMTSKMDNTEGSNKMIRNEEDGMVYVDWAVLVSADWG